VSAERFAWMDDDLDAASTLSVVSILKGLCHLNDVRVDQRHVHIHQCYLYREDDMARKAKKAKKAAATRKVAKKTSAKKKK